MSVTVEFLTAMKDRLYHIGTSFTLQVGQYSVVLHVVRLLRFDQ